MPSGELRLNVPWVPETPQQMGGLTVRRGRENVLTYDDGITLKVLIVDAGPHKSVESLLDETRRQAGPGRVVLVSGAVPVEWRGHLRRTAVSFLDASGVAAIDWPRLRIRERRFGQPATRQTAPLPLQKGYAAVAQELLIVSEHHQTTVTAIAEGAEVSLSSASRAIDRLATQGLLTKRREGRQVFVSIIDPVDLADHLAQRTAWGRTEILGGYLWGRNSLDVAARLSAQARTAEIDLAVTGQVGAAFLGVIGTTSPAIVHCWVSARSRSLAEIAVELGLEETPSEEGTNVALAIDRWHVGHHRCAPMMFDDWEATIAHPVRVWCDLHGEPRGEDFAAQLWGMISHGR